MDLTSTTALRIGAWRVDPAAGSISRGSESIRVEARSLRLLLCLARHAGQVVSVEELLAQVWPDVIVTSDSVYQAVASLRRILGDDPRRPVIIATVPRLGYRMVAAVTPWTDSAAEPPESASASLRRPALIWIAAAVLALTGIVALLFRGNIASALDHRSGKSVAVLPFLDLTTEMNEEPFADGMTEELINRLSRIPGIRVPGPTSSFYFRGKRIPVADIGRMLSVAYVLDGSVRKSGGRLRVSTRLIRTDSGFVVWAGTYDRPFGDILMVQDDIAGRVTNALRTSFDHARLGN